MNEKTERLQTLQRNIDRFHKLLNSNLSQTELRFVERRLSEERFMLAMLQAGRQGSAADKALPDWPQAKQ